MKAEIKKDGYIHITAETATEAFALKHILGKTQKVPNNMVKPLLKAPPVLFNLAIVCNGVPAQPPASE